MATVLSNGYTVTQHHNYIVTVSKNGKNVINLKFSRELSCEELNELAFWSKITL